MFQRDKSPLSYTSSSSSPHSPPPVLPPPLHFFSPHGGISSRNRQAASTEPSGSEGLGKLQDPLISLIPLLCCFKSAIVAHGCNVCNVVGVYYSVCVLSEICYLMSVETNLSTGQSTNHILLSLFQHSPFFNLLLIFLHLSLPSFTLLPLFLSAVQKPFFF